MATGSEVRRKHEFFLCLLFLLVKLSDCQLSDVLAQGQELRQGSQLASATGIFVLRFMGSRSLHSFYLGIQHYPYSIAIRPVWFANRNSPFHSKTGSLTLTIDSNGSLKVISKGEDEFSFSLYDVEEATNTSAILMDSGNFVLRELNPDGSVKRQLWQSFDYPTDALLPGMKLGINHRTGSTWSLTSWRSPITPQSGAFTLVMNPNNTNELVMLLRGDVFWTSGNWERGRFEFSEQPSSINNQFFNFRRFSNENETYFNYSTSKYYSTSSQYANVLPVLTISDLGFLMWGGSYPLVYCAFFDDESSYSYENYNSNAFRDGCVWQKHHKIPKCRNVNSTFDVLGRPGETGSMEGNSIKYQESENLTLYECQNMCISNCDCVAFAFTNEDRTGCEIWSTGATFISSGRDMRQIKVLNTSQSLRIYEHEPPKARAKVKKVWIIVGVTGVTTILLLCFILCIIWKTQIAKVIEKVWRKKDSEQRKFLYDIGVNTSKSLNMLRTKNKQRKYEKKSSELQFFRFESVVAATNNFANENRLGEGGFGPVYKGSLDDGQEVAIKRLSRSSGQGLEEFKNEVILIAKLQHTNLVRLIGCCIYKEEKMLIYEYMPNKSLDFFLFDREKKLTLDWNRRFNIIEGIIQGLLYLHNYSRLRIIHRDLKASNILLDEEMNAKISDFGMARIFKPTDHEANTSRIVGTYGYISPEYAMEGIFSIKSDVYSFGVLLLEIITGQKNYTNFDPERHLNLIGYAWELWVNDRGEELIDSTLCNSDHQKSKVLRCFHVGLLCVQQIPVDRPTMLDVSYMIHNDSTQLSMPKQPTSFFRRNSQPSAGETLGNWPRSQSTSETYSSNKMSISEILAR